MSLKVLVKIPLSTFSGYGRDGIGLVRALAAAGIDVYLRPTGIQAPVPQEVANLLTKELRAPFDLSITHIDPMAMKLDPDMEVSCQTNVAWTMWEWSSTANLSGRSTLKKRLNPFDSLITYDEVTKEALSPFFRGPVIKQQGGSEFGNWSYIERDWNEENFYFGMVGAPLSMRKNPFIAIRAFSELKAEDPEFDKHARMMLKTSRDDKSLSPRMEDIYPGLRVFADAWDEETLREFYGSLHVLLAPSWGEGKHLPSLEFLATGGTVIATNYGGMAEWLHPDYAYPLNEYEMKPMDIIYAKSPSASVSVEELKRHMLHAFYNRSEAEEKGRIGSNIIPQMCSWDAVVEKLFEKLRDLEHGEELWTKYQIAKGEAHARSRD